MKLTFSKQAYDQLDDQSRGDMTKVNCDCVEDAIADPDCDLCDGYGVLYEHDLPAETEAAIRENFARQGVPLGKTGAH